MISKRLSQYYLQYFKFDIQTGRDLAVQLHCVQWSNKSLRSWLRHPDQQYV